MYLLFILSQDASMDGYNRIANCKYPIPKMFGTPSRLFGEGNERVKENNMKLLIQQYESFHFKAGESLSDTFNRFQKMLNGLKLYGRIYQVKDSNLKFLRALPKEWKPMTVSFRNIQEF